MVRASAWAGVQRGGIHAVNLGVLLILSRLLRPADIGLVALATALISGGQVVIDLGLSQALIQRRELSDLDSDTVFGVTLASGLVLGTGLVVFAEPISALFHDPTLIPILRWSAFSLVFLSLIATQKALLQRDLAFGRLASRTLAAELAGGALGILLAVKGLGVWSLVARNLARDFVAVLVFWRAASWTPRVRASAATWREMRSFGAAAMGSRALEFLSQSADQVLVGYFAGATLLGYYVVGLRIVRAIRQLLVESLSSVAFPFFSRLQDEPARLRQAFLTGLRLTTLGSVPAFLGTALVAPEVVGLLLGPAWQASVPVIQIMAVAAIVQAAGFFPGAVLLAVGRPVWRLGLNLVNSLGNVAAVLLAVPQGLIGMALAQAIRAYLFFPLSLYAARVALGLRWREYARAWWPAAMASAIMTLGVSLARRFFFGSMATWVSLLFLVGVGAAVYVLAIHAIAPRSWREVRGLFQILFLHEAREEP